jgi:hypothetical protein
LVSGEATANEASAEFNPDPSLEIDGGLEVTGTANEEAADEADANSAAEPATKPPAT